MTCTILDLPNECIDLILSNLHPFEIRLVALTFNRRLFAFTSPIINHLMRKIASDELHLESILGKLDYGEETRAERLTRHLAYLHPTDDITWVSTVTQPDDSEPERWPHVSEDDLDHLIHTTRQLGLTLPPSLSEIFRNGLWHKVFWSDDHVKVTGLNKFLINSNPGEDKTDASTQTEHLSVKEGYAIMFWEDQQGCGCLHLYMDRTGRHAVVFGSGENAIDDRWPHEYPESELAKLTDEERRLDVELGQPISGENLGKLVDIDFGHWLKDTSDCNVNH